jgi:hypothetical protein
MGEGIFPRQALAGGRHGASSRERSGYELR